MGGSNTPSTNRYTELPPMMRRTGPFGLSPLQTQHATFTALRFPYFAPLTHVRSFPSKTKALSDG
jgi:hypothetical protein